MRLESISKYRLERNMRRETLAEKTELFANYIGMIERGEKLSKEDKDRIYDNAEVIIRHSKA